jgi:hypothetical protein
MSFNLFILIGISTEQDVMQAAAERILDSNRRFGERHCVWTNENDYRRHDHRKAKRRPL